MRGGRAVRHGKNVVNYQRVRELLIQGAVIVLAGLWIYSPTYHGDWLWDDDVLLTANPTVQSGTLAGLLKLWLNPDGIDYFPLSYSLLWLQAQFFGPQSTGYHVTTILLHIVSGLLLWALLAEMKVPGAWTAALVFTIHPVCVESVAWVSETKNTLSLALFLASCIFWVRQDDRQPGPTRERLYLIALAFFLLAMFAKTSVVAMPVLTLLYAWWKRGGATMQDAVRAAPMFLVSLVLGIVTIQYQHGRAIGLEELPVGGIASRIAIAGMAILFYLATIVWPVNLLPIYPRWDVEPPQAWQFLPGLVIGGAAWWLWTNRREIWARHAILAFGFFLLMIAPVLGFVDISYMRITWVADHFLYLPMIGPLVLIVAGVTTWLETRADRERSVFTAMAGGVLFFLAVNAFFYAISWQDEEHLWEHTPRLKPRCLAGPQPARCEKVGEGGRRRGLLSLSAFLAAATRSRRDEKQPRHHPHAKRSGRSGDQDLRRSLGGIAVAASDSPQPGRGVRHRRPLHRGAGCLCTTLGDRSRQCRRSQQLCLGTLQVW